MNIQGRDQIIKGTVLYFLADTLAAHSIGGFKGGLSRALRKCRCCLATYEQMSTKVNKTVNIISYKPNIYGNLLYDTVQECRIYSENTGNL